MFTFCSHVNSTMLGVARLWLMQLALRLIKQHCLIAQLMGADRKIGPVGDLHMAVERQPIAFLSYVRSDDDHDGGRITAFRKRLEGEVRMQTGQAFEIFQDRNDISWGQHWEDQINSSLSEVAFLIPIISPSFFRSRACRSEFQTFSLKKKRLGVNRLILPLYYVECDQFGDGYDPGSDEIVDILRMRNWTDWRVFRFKPFEDEQVAKELAKMATMVKSSIKELDAIAVAASSPEKENSGPASARPITPKQELPAIGASEQSRKSDLPQDPIYEIAEARPSGEASGKIITIARPYYAYTKAFDEVIDAAKLASDSELLRLYNYVSSLSADLKNLHGARLASKLGLYERVSAEHPLAVSILIDNSGSMRGTPIIQTAAWCLLIMEGMDRLGIPTEILGFTTRAWKGGQSREA